MRTLKDYEYIGDVKGQGSTNSAIGCVYRYSEDYPEALKYERRANELLNMSKDSLAVFSDYSNQICLCSDMNHKNLQPFIDSVNTYFKVWKSTNLRHKLSNDSWCLMKRNWFSSILVKSYFL